MVRFHTGPRDNCDFPSFASADRNDAVGPRAPMITRQNLVAIVSIFLFFSIYAEGAPSPTFSEQIAPIVFEHCSICHRPGQPAPFSLLNYDDVAKHKQTILKVINSRQMPPWLPAPQQHAFKGERRLSEAEIHLLSDWINNGSPEGDPKKLPPVPQWSDGWFLGKPDLVLTMPEVYHLRADGEDVYRAFVIPGPTSATQYIAAVEFNPGNYQVVHHAFIRLDSSKRSRRHDAEDPEPGFPGLHAPGTTMPEGFFSSWQPGKMASRYPQGLSWALNPGTDIVIQMHMRPSGKSEEVRAKVGFYYAKNPPARTPLKIYLRNTSMEIPAGATNYVVEDSLQLPVDLQVLAVLPHAHYLAKEIEAFAELPGGGTENLLRIPDWDFSWQGDYSYQNPIRLPRGSVLRMRVHYDNSTNNVRNPSNPPRQVKYGLQSTDEMAEVWFQVMADSISDHALLNKSLIRRMLGDTMAYNEFLLRSNPNDPIALFQLGKAYIARREYGRAENFLDRSIKAQPEAEAYYHLGLLNEIQGAHANARKNYEAALQLNPDYHMAHNNLGLLWLEAGNYTNAIHHFREAIRLAPADSIPHENLKLAERLLKEAKKP
jgi:hypothetical protein